MGNEALNSGRFLPDRAYFAELARPWKLATFAIAMAALLYGAVYYRVSDWDVGVTIIMGVMTYVTAPWSVATIGAAVRHRPRAWPLRILAALAVAWFVVDGDYVLYHTLVGNRMMRLDNFYASTPLYFMAGAFWLYRGTLADFARNVRRLLRPAG